ncbi:Protein CBG12496 [Caenorhabditis briggsae]|uniref:Protein CBG12496 n=1 Tax=Caenorhabditis briggsae TaxID=6238 RepID=A8XFW5_CAEBR|nr:Protein CBG12496 [Caenorhabditis briggsae]CAP31469.2 Protein CBG12496 [Caenorhabditis briggsae]
MFRKPKTKGAIRQRNTEAWDEPDAENQDKPPINEVKKTAVPRATISFDADEGADSFFKLKKDKKKVEELKRQHRLEEEAEQICKQEKERKEALEKIVKKEKQSREDKKTNNEKQKYLDKYRDKSAKHISNTESFDYDEDLNIDGDAISSVSNKFASVFEGIPDSRAVFEAKKRRERARREGNQDGYIPLDDTQKLKSKNERNRLIREDENDDSDEECANNFYSARELLRSEEDRRREEQERFLEREHGDVDESDRKKDEDSENEEWERQQIRKAVSKREVRTFHDSVVSDHVHFQIVQLRTEKRNTSQLFGHVAPIEDDTAMDMDIDLEMDVQVIGKPDFSGPKNTGGVVKIGDILAKLKLRIQERDEALNFRKEEKRKLHQNIEENKALIAKLESELPTQSTKYTMYQELRVYSRRLLECLNEKVAEINGIVDKRRDCGRAKTMRIMSRRRQDTRDQHAECMQGKSAKMGEAATRSAEREARRTTSSERETTLSGISHEEGLSTDDEETTQQTASDKKTYDEVEAVASVLFADALDEYSDLRKVLGRMIDWLAVDSKSFQDAYVYLCLPKLCSPYVRLEMLQADILNNETVLTSMQWFKTAVLAGSENAEIDQTHDILVELAPAIIEKVVVPFLIDTVKEEWDPMSLRQTRNLATCCSIFEKLPNLTEKSKQFNALLMAIRERICDALTNDIFMPIFMPNMIEQPSCRQFHDRQYWSCIKVTITKNAPFENSSLQLIRSINALSSIISVAARFELVVEKCVNSHCVMAFRTGVKNEVSVERKIRGLFTELDDALLMMGGRTSFRQLISSLQIVAEAQNQAGRSFHKEIDKYLMKLER